ncbi:carotenoid cleavage dioxygenase 8 homolog B, chloroplastic-like [Bidens hawaiensis]|uniref:carotenoid cleavage dioxygenase 8 homolog B, chloroplastic-like n=1 Tax=Bidens hawaiensis TaxID=980011 RepID=UPI00404A3B78
MGHRQIESNAYKAAEKSNKLCYREFSEVPKHDNFLAYIGDLANLFSGASLTDNANTGVVKLADGRVVCLTETIKGSIVIDPNTLDTLEKFEYDDSWGGLIHSAHPIVTDSEFITLLPDLINPGYMVVRMEPGTNERKVIGRVDCRGGPSPGWVHSFPVTEHYVIVPEMPLRYCAQNLLKAEPTPLYKFRWYPESKGFMHVMCKASGKIVASVEVPLFVTFHFINAYEEKDEDGRITGVIADCCEHYADTTILDNLRLQNLRSWSGEDVLPDARVGRFRTPLDGSDKGELFAALNPDEHGRGMDMCSINPNFLGRQYRYAYACGAQRPCNFPNTLTKINLVDGKAKNWYDEGAVPSEPYFVARPGATEEDDVFQLYYIAITIYNVNIIC